MLHEIGLKTGTDKATYHNYCGFYEQNLGHLKDKNISLLEIGIKDGASLLMWAEYFHNAQIHGIDIVKKHINHPRIACHRGDGTKDRLVGKFDVVIDDGSHEWADQIATYELYKEHCGIFIMEDLHTSFIAHWAKGPVSPFEHLLSDCQRRGARLRVFRKSVSVWHDSVTAVISRSPLF
jgi:hypothetical protein